MARMFAFLIGVTLLGAGIAGFMPQFFTDGLLFGYFKVDDMHNKIHIVTGALFLLSAFSTGLSKFFLIIFGLVYIAAGAYGIWHQGDLVIMQANSFDNFLHIGLGTIALLFGAASNGG